METKKELLMRTIQECIDERKTLAVFIDSPGLKVPEVILNDFYNVETKRDYYDNAYTDDLVLKTFDKIRIVDFKAVNVNTLNIK